MYYIKPEQFIEGTIICDNCHNKIYWRYNIPLKEYGMYVGSYTTDTVFAYKKNKYDDNTYCVRCKKCDKLITFTYE